MSERSLDSSLSAGSQSSHFRYVVLVDIDFPGGNVRVHNSVGTLSFGGNTYLGVGAFGSIDGISETIEMVDQPVNLTLSGIDSDIIQAVTETNIYGRDVEIFLGSLDEGNQLDGTPTSWVVGSIEKSSVNVGAENAVSITVQTRAAKLRRRNNKRWTIEHHQRDYPGDRFFEFLPYVVNAKVEWGGEQVRTGYRNTDDNIGGSSDDGGRTGPRSRFPNRRHD